jgi:hypothetical protein
MPSKFVSLFYVCFLLFFSISCARGSIDPASPSLNPEIQPPATQNQSLPIANSTHYLWAYQLISIDPSTLDAALIPIRVTAMHMNVLSFLEKGPCTNCLKITKVVPGPDATLFIDISIKHPYANLNFTGFDVRGITIFKGSHLFPSSGLNLSDQNLGDGELLNPDGYTSLYHPATIGHGMEGYLKGKLSSVPVPDASINGYKRFITYNPGNTRNAFYAADTIAVTYQIKIPAGPLVFGYAVDASWTPPLNKPVKNPITDFGPDANCPEAWKITVSTITDGEGLTDCGGQLSVVVDIFDWQSVDESHPVLLECPEIFDGQIEALWKSDSTGFSTYEALIANIINAPSGTYRCLVTKEPAEYNPSKPWLNLSAYQITDLTVSTHIDLPPVAIAEASQPSAFIGEEAVFDGTSSYDSDCDNQSIVKYEWDWNNDGVFDQKGSKPAHSYDTAGIYYIQLRVTDDDGSIDMLDTPIKFVAYNLPPFNLKDVSRLYYRNGKKGFGIDMVGTIAYMTYAEGDIDGSKLLKIVDLANPATPHWLGAADFESNNYWDAIHVRDGYAYIPTDDTLVIIDVDPPQQAHVVNTVKFDCSPMGEMAFYGNYAIITAAQWECPLYAVDISSPENAYIYSTLPEAGAADIRIRDDKAYLADGEEMIVVDLEPVDQMSIVAKVETAGTNSVYISLTGDYAYLLGNYILSIMDISNPETPSMVNSIKLDYGIYFDTYGDYLYSHESIGFSVYDITDHVNPVLQTSVSTSGFTGKYCFSGDFLYTPHEYMDYSVIDIADPPQAFLASAYFMNLNNLFKDGLLYSTEGHIAGDPDYGFNITDLNSDPPGSAKMLAEYHTEVNDFDLFGKLAYIASYDGLELVDVALPDSPILITEVPGTGLSDIVYESGYAYTCGSTGLKIFDVDPPESAYLVTELTGPTVISTKITVSDGMIYVVNDNQDLVIIDATTPESAHVVTIVPDGNLDVNVAVCNGYAYIGDLTLHNLSIFDIDPPGEAHLATTAFDGYVVNDIGYAYGYLFTAIKKYQYGDPSLWVLDPIDPENPLMVDSIVGLFDQFRISDGYLCADYAYYHPSILSLF